MRSFGGAFAITGIAYASQLAVDGLTATTSGDTSDVFTSMGVFAAALAVAYFMLRRGDKREREMLVASAAELERLRKDLLHSTDKLVETLIENAALKAELVRLKAREQ